MPDEPFVDLLKNPELAAEMASNSVVHYLKGIEGFETLAPQEKHSWVKGVFEKVMSKIGLASSGSTVN